jgi:hypothetical protein
VYCLIILFQNGFNYYFTPQNSLPYKNINQKLFFIGVRNKVVTAIAVLFSMSGVAQENLLWYFGQGQAGLSFDKNGGAPVVSNDAAFLIYESISVVSDCNGALAFYTDGVKVYDASHNLMVNG